MIFHSRGNGQIDFNSQMIVVSDIIVRSSYFYIKGFLKA